MVLNIELKLLQYTHLQLLIVVNALCNPVDGIFECSDGTFILANLGAGRMDGRLHLLLLQSQVLYQEAQVGVDLVEHLQFTILGIRLQSQLACFNLLRSDLFLKLLDAIVKDELKLFELLRLSLQLIDLGLALTNLCVLLLDLFKESLNVI